MDREVLLAAEVAPRLRCCPRKVYTLFETGELEGFRLGRAVRIFGDSVDRFIARNANQKAEEGSTAVTDFVVTLPAPAPRPPRGRSRAPAQPVGLRHLRL